MYIDSFLTYDSWSSYPYHVSPSVEALRTINFQSFGYRSLRIEYFTTSSSHRNIHLEWITPSSFNFSPVPNTSLTIVSHELFSYTTSLLTCYVNQQFELSPIIDYSIFSHNGKEICDVNYSILNQELPNIIINAHSGVVSGFLAEEQYVDIHVSVTVVCSANIFNPTTMIHIHTIACTYSIFFFFIIRS